MNLYITDEMPCHYLPGQRSRQQVVVPIQRIRAQEYTDWVAQGFRRGGVFVYRPHCLSCHACIAYRVLALAFEPNRSQRRNWRRFSHLQVQQVSGVFKAEHFALYQRYQHSRHGDGPMANDREDAYKSFLLDTVVPTQWIEFRVPTVDVGLGSHTSDEAGELVMVCVIDLLDNGVSSVYTFFHPDSKWNGLGKFGILWQIQWARSQNLPYVYLGYWVENSRKMAYKSEYQPAEVLQGGGWQRVAAVR